MSSLPSVCPNCGLHYRDFRTGLTFRDAFESFWTPDRPPSEWVTITRRLCLGRWWEWKQAYWAQHLEHCITDVEVTWDREEY